MEDSGGTIAITNSNISGGFEDNLRVDYNNGVADRPPGSPSPGRRSATCRPPARTPKSTALPDVCGGRVGRRLQLHSNTFENDANTLPPGGTKNWSDGILVRSKVHSRMT